MQSTELFLWQYASPHVVTYFIENELNMQPTTALDQKGIWIASYPKSGNTWTRIFIHNLILEIEGKTEQAQDINRLREHTTWELTAPAFEKVLGKPVTEATHIEIAQARYEVQRQLAQKQTKPFFIKTHNSVANIEGYPTINMEMTLAAIYIVRNPLDVAISWAEHMGLSIDQSIAYMGTSGVISRITERVVYEFSDSWSEHAASWMSISTRPVHVMRYEDMLRNPEGVFSRLATFLRMKPTPEQLLSAIKKSSFESLVEQESQNGFIERPRQSKVFFRKGQADQWKEILTPSQINTIIEAHGPMMQRFGYLIPNCGREVWQAPQPMMTT